MRGVRAVVTLRRCVILAVRMGGMVVAVPIAAFAMSMPADTGVLMMADRLALRGHNGRQPLKRERDGQERNREKAEKFRHHWQFYVSTFERQHPPAVPPNGPSNAMLRTVGVILRPTIRRRSDIPAGGRRGSA